MNKKAFICFMLLSMLMIVACTSEKKGFVPMLENKDGEVLVYTLNIEATKRFLKNPQISELNANGDFERVSIYKISNLPIISSIPHEELEEMSIDELENEGLLVDDYVYRKTIYSTGETREDGSISGYMRISYLPVYMEFIDYVGHAQNIKELLLQNNIDCEVEQYYVLAFFSADKYNYPPTLWVKSNLGEHLFMIDGSAESSIESNSPETEFRYTLYSYDEYRDRTLSTAKTKSAAKKR